MTHVDETATTNDQQPSGRGQEGGLSRRVVLCGATLCGVSLPLLAACSGSGSSSGSSESSGSSGPATVAAADVPVGGGTILTAEMVVVTQPTKGEFKAFSAICTHQGCPVGSVTGGEIVCPCHSSHFSISDGSPVSGPAPSPLPAKTVTVEGGQVSVT